MVALGCVGLTVGVGATATGLGFPVHYGLLGMLAGLGTALGFLVPPRSRASAS